MLRISVVVFVDAATFQFKLSQQSGINELNQSAIDRWSTDVPRFASGRQAIHQLIRIKVFVIAENQIQQHLPLLSAPHPTTLQIVTKPLLGR